MVKGRVEASYKLVIVVVVVIGNATRTLCARARAEPESQRHLHSTLLLSPHHNQQCSQASSKYSAPSQPSNHSTPPNQAAVVTPSPLVKLTKSSTTARLVTPSLSMAPVSPSQNSTPPHSKSVLLLRHYEGLIWDN